MIIKTKLSYLDRPEPVALVEQEGRQTTWPLHTLHSLGLATHGRHCLHIRQLSMSCALSQQEFCRPREGRGGGGGGYSVWQSVCAKTYQLN